MNRYEDSSHLSGTALTRRRFLRAGSTLAAGASLAGLGACGDAARDPAAESISIPDPAVKLPSGDVTFRLMDSNDTKAPFWRELFTAYQKKHGNITCKYDGLPWERIEELAPLGIRNGTAHDVLQLPATIQVPQAVAEGWIAPLDEVLPDLDAWKRNYPEGVFAEGVNVFDGRHYTVPLATEQRHLALLHYNKTFMDDAGYDPQAQPLTWDEYRDAAKKITQQNKGRAYGVVYEIAQPGRLEIAVRYLAGSAGAPAVALLPLGHMDLRDGEFFYDRDEVREAIELMLAVKTDGSVFPGSNSLVAPEAWPRVVRGNAGMVLGGPWVTALWRKESPQFAFGVASHPVADRSGGPPPGYPVFGSDAVVVYSGSKLKAVAGDVLSYVCSVDGQKAWGEFVGVGNPPINEEARKGIGAGVSTQEKTCLRLAEQLVAQPAPEIRNPDTARVSREHKGVSPTFGEVIQSALVGETTDLKQALRKLKDASDRALDDAIATANKKGATVSRDDWVFRNWDPTRDYTTKDYEAL